MKLISKNLLCHPLFCLLSIAGCKKNNSDDGLPPLTFIGANTIGCKINDDPWIPKGIYSLGVTYYPTKGGYYSDPLYPGVHILLKTYSPDGEIELFCRNYSGVGYIQPGRYYFIKNTQPISGYFEIHNYGQYFTNGRQYITDSIHTGWIDIIKSDSVNKIVSGKFEFDAYNSIDKKVYRITEGRFDYKTH
jgi:hypothetical protein